MRALALTTIALSLIVSFGCKKPRKFVRTKAQQARVDEAVLKSAPTPRFKVDANFQDTVRLIGVDVDPALPTPGGKITVHFYWEVLKAFGDEGDWMIFVHVEGPVAGGGQARVIADHYAVEDGPGGAGLYPPKEWKKGQIIKDTKTVDLVDPRGRKLGPGLVSIYLGFFDMDAYKNKQQDVRLTLKNPETIENDGNHRVLAARFQVGKGGPTAKKPFKAPRLFARKAVSPITVDGKLDEPAWRAAVTTAAFGRPDGKPLAAAMRSQVRLLWDDEALYAGFIVRDETPTSKFTTRDETLWDEDVVELYLDPNGDSKDYVELQISPKNVVFDALFKTRRTPKWEEASKWNLPGLETAVHIGGLPGRTTVNGWTVEVKIPWSGLVAAHAKKPSPGDTWKANFFRIEKPGDLAHLAAWSPVSDDARADFHNLDRAGFLVFAETPAAVKARVLRAPQAQPKVQPSASPTAAKVVAPAHIIPAKPGTGATPTALPKPAAPTAKPAEK